MLSCKFRSIKHRQFVDNRFFNHTLSFIQGVLKVCFTIHTQFFTTWAWVQNWAIPPVCSRFPSYFPIRCSGFPSQTQVACYRISTGFANPRTKSQVVLGKLTPVTHRSYDLWDDPLGKYSGTPLAVSYGTVQTWGCPNKMAILMGKMMINHEKP